MKKKNKKQKRKEEMKGVIKIKNTKLDMKEE